jgi:PAS domain S-box-containing protein
MRLNLPGEPRKNEIDHFRLLADRMPQLVWTTKADGSADYFNERWRRYTGTSAEESLGEVWQTVIHPGDLQACLDHWGRSVATGCDYEIEFRIRRGSDGTYRWHLTRGSPLRNKRNEIIQWIGTCTDIDDQKRARSELEAQVAERTAEIMRGREQLQTVLDGATQVAMIATTAKGLITLFNSGATNMLGYTSEEVVGKHTPALFHLASELIARGIELTGDTGRQVDGFGVFTEKTGEGQHEEREWTYVRKDGSHLPVSLVVTYLGKAGFLGVAMDLTERKRAEDAARASQEHFRFIGETVEDYALIMLDPEGQVITWNVGAERIEGYQADEISGKHFSTFYTPEDIEKRHPDAELQIAADQGRFSEEGWRVRKDGSRFLADVYIAAIRNDEGRLLGFAKVVHDVTERKKNEDRFQMAVEAAPSAMIMVNDLGQITMVNSQTEILFQFTREELLGKRIEMLLPKHHRLTHIAHRTGFLKESAPRRMGADRELFALRKDGTQVPVEIGLNPIDTSEGKLVLASIVDITNRQLAERSLRNQALILDLAGDAVFIRDGEDRITYWNQGAQRLYGWSKEEVLGQVTHLLLKTRFPLPLSRIEAQTRSEGYWKGELVHTSREGSLITVYSSWTKHFDETTTNSIVLEINQDITARKEIERELAINRHDLLQGSLRLLAVNKELEEFAYVASHDLKAPLRVIDNASKWLEDDLAEYLTADTRETMKLLRGRVQRMEKLLDDLLEYARIGRTPGGPPGKEVAGDILVSDVLALLPTANFTFVIDPLFSFLQLRQMPLQHILSNLIGNAIKHHDKSEGRIELTVKNSGEFYEFAVRDDGPGIPVQFHHQIFKMFQTLRPRDQVEGSGMGLAMARKTVELFGGVLSVDPHPGRGCTFRFTWPIEEPTGSDLSSELIDRTSPNTPDRSPYRG